MLDIVFREDECRVRKMKIEKKRVSAKRRMMHVALDSDFLHEALFSE
jgi:hypothetical protein